MGWKQEIEAWMVRNRDIIKNNKKNKIALQPFSLAHCVDRYKCMPKQKLELKEVADDYSLQFCNVVLRKPFNIIQIYYE